MDEVRGMGRPKVDKGLESERSLKIMLHLILTMKKEDYKMNKKASHTFFQ